MELYFKCNLVKAMFGFFKRDFQLHVFEMIFKVIFVALLVSSLSQSSLAKKAYANSEKFGKTGLTPVIRQKYCNFDYLMTDQQNERIWSCVFQPSFIVSTFQLYPILVGLET